MTNSPEHNRHAREYAKLEPSKSSSHMFTVIPCTVRNLIRKTSAYSTLRKIRFRIDYLRWDKSSVPPPHYVKQKIVLEYARKYQCKTLIETGTHLGFMVDVMKNHFKKIDSIEFDPAL